MGLFVLVPLLGEPGAAICYGMSTLIVLIYVAYRWNVKVENFREEKPKFSVHELIKTGVPFLGGMLLI